VTNEYSGFWMQQGEVVPPPLHRAWTAKDVQAALFGDYKDAVALYFLDNPQVERDILKVLAARTEAIIAHASRVEPLPLVSMPWDGDDSGGPELTDNGLSIDFISAHSDFTPEELTAASLISKGKGTAAAAKAVGVDRTTVFRWRKDEGFQALLADVAAELARGN
jgi:hypothetical protein